MTKNVNIKTTKTVTTETTITTATSVPANYMPIDLEKDPGAEDFYKANGIPVRSMENSVRNVFMQSFLSKIMTIYPRRKKLQVQKKQEHSVAILIITDVLLSVLPPESQETKTSLLIPLWQVAMTLLLM